MPRVFQAELAYNVIKKKKQKFMSIAHHLKATLYCVLVLSTRYSGIDPHHIHACFPAPCSADHMLHIHFHALPIYPHIPESGVMPCSNVLSCTGLKLKAIHHVPAPLRSTTSAEQPPRGSVKRKERQRRTYIYHVCFWICSNCKR